MDEQDKEKTNVIDFCQIQDKSPSKNKDKSESDFSQISRGLDRCGFGLEIFSGLLKSDIRMQKKDRHVLADQTSVLVKEFADVEAKILEVLAHFQARIEVLESTQL